jgi:hypothetical protein
MLEGFKLQPHVAGVKATTNSHAALTQWNIKLSSLKSHKGQKSIPGPAFLQQHSHPERHNKMDSSVLPTSQDIKRARAQFLVMESMSPITPNPPCRCRCVTYLLEPAKCKRAHAHHCQVARSPVLSRSCAIRLTRGLLEHHLPCPSTQAAASIHPRLRNAGLARRNPTICNQALTGPQRPPLQLTPSH